MSLFQATKKEKRKLNMLYLLFPQVFLLRQQRQFLFFFSIFFKGWATNVKAEIEKATKQNTVF